MRSSIMYTVHQIMKDKIKYETDSACIIYSRDKK
jgi:hypothetical protein